MRTGTARWGGERGVRNGGEKGIAVPAKTNKLSTNATNECGKDGETTTEKNTTKGKAKES